VLRIALIQRFLPSRSRGGVGHFAHGLAETLVRRGHHVTMFSEDPLPAGASYSHRLVPARGGVLAPLVFPWSLRACDFTGFDVIHAQGDEQWISHRAAPVVRTMHGTGLAEAWFNGVRGRSLKRTGMFLWFYLMEVIADSRADAVAVISAGTSAFYPKTTAVVPNGIDAARFADARARVHKSTAPSILFVGQLHSRKRGAWLVDVFRRDVRSRVSNAELWLVSPDSVDVPADSGVVHLGALSDEALADKLAEAWIMCLPSAYEGFGRPYAEAMAAGAVAASTPNAGANDVLDGGNAGLLADDNVLGASLAALLVDASARQRFIEAGAARVRQYEWDVVAAQYESLYARVIDARARAQRRA